MARLPDKDTARRAFAELDFAQRRAIARSVNRGEAVEHRKHAVLAVMLARRQQKLWRWMWVAGPLVGVAQLGVGWEAAVLGGALATLTMALVSRWWWGRAKRAEERNLELVQGGAKKRKGGGSSSPTATTRGPATTPKPRKDHVPRSKRKKR